MAISKQTTLFSFVSRDIEPSTSHSDVQESSQQTTSEGKLYHAIFKYSVFRPMHRCLATQ